VITGPLWLDIWAEHIKMHHHNPIQRPTCRHLKCHDPCIAEHYLYVLSCELDQINAEEQLQELVLATSTQSWMTEHEAAYNVLDQEIIIEAKLKAEQLCQKIQVGNTPWTSELTQAIQQILYWKGTLKQMQGGTISTTVLKRLAVKGLIRFQEVQWKLPSNVLKQKVEVAYSDYCSLKLKRTIKING